MLMHGRPVLNLVYRFVPEVWGRGFATEAAAAVVSRTLDEMPAETIVARVRPDNRASQNVALKAGRKIQWDAEKGQVVGDKEAQRLATPAYRAPWRLPSVG